MKELKKLGVQNSAKDRQRSLTSKGTLKKLIQAYEGFRNPEGKLPATWEIIYGHAWTAEKKSEKQKVVSFQEEHFCQILLVLFELHQYSILESSFQVYLRYFG